MANQGPVGNRMKRFARTADIRASNFLTVSIFIVVLVTVACATSSYAVAHHQQHSSYSTSREHQPHLALKRSSPSTFENFEPLFERPQVYSEYKPTLNGQRDQDFDAADEEFLRQLKEAARYLDDKLAERQRQQEQLALLERASANGFARRPYGELNGRQQFDDDAAREPVYSVLDEQRLAEPHVGSDLSWRPLNEAANTNDVTEIEPDVTDEASVVVVAPSGANGASKLISSAPDVVDDYRLLLADQLEEQNQRQNAFNTDAKYKQSLKSFLLDQAQANSLAPAANNDNQKRDAPAATPEPRSDTSQRAARFTTLLEDEDEDSAKKEDDAPASKVAYGTVYDRPAAANGTAPTGGGSIFKRLYSNVAYYLPFITQLSNLRRETASNTTTGTGDSVETNSGRQQGAVGDQLHAKTNISDSSTLGGSAPSEQNEGDIGETGGQGHRTAVAGSNQDNQQSQQNDDKHGVAASGTNSTSDPSENAVMIADPLIETSGRHSAGTTKKNDNRVDEPSYGLKRDRTRQFASENGDLDVDMSQMMSTALNPDGQSYDNTANQYNMMKQSSLMLPVGSSSDMLLESSPRNLKKEPDSLLGKYIYAPTQHYYLNSVMPPTDGIPHLGPLGHHPALVGKHFQAGDAVYGPYGEMPMKAAYAFQKERNTLGDKSNDLYFLIMVGAFCVMAMAVVLAAGMFAYRVQQSRKTSQDTDYPTYGVVGPNNMSAKCGAASFVGGYFTGPASGSSKSGSVKHLPDIYGIPGGNGGSDSGLNSLDKSSSNKKASSVSSLNEHHQSAGSRAGSSNFMAAASQDAARMYHYQHQKQQMIISDRSSGGRQTSASDLDSEDENDDGSYTVYECPGLASAHEMEIKNPLFNDDQSP